METSASFRKRNRNTIAFYRNAYLCGSNRVSPAPIADIGRHARHGDMVVRRSRIAGVRQLRQSVTPVSMQSVNQG
jgi:hypothetical protein